MRQQVNKLYFLIHPTCWAHTGYPVAQIQLGSYSASDWFAALHWEQKVNARQKRFIEEMGKDEALVIRPSGDSKPMRELEECAQQALGDRCLIIRSPSIPQPPGLQKSREPIRKVLRNVQSNGLSECWSALPDTLRTPIKQEIQLACEKTGYDWSAAALKVLMDSYVHASDITALLKQRNLHVDPASVAAEAFGEMFEQCAMTWKAMTPHCLGWRKPIENEFNLSVSGSPLLFDARLVERIRLPHDIRLFVWEKSHERPVALFARARCRLSDPRYEVVIPLDAAVWEVWTPQRRVWPRRPTHPKRALRRRRHHRAPPGRRLHLPIYAAIHKYPDDQPYYLLAPNLSIDAFVELLVHAPIRPVRERWK